MKTNQIIIKVIYDINNDLITDVKDVTHMDLDENITESPNGYYTELGKDYLQFHIDPIKFIGWYQNKNHNKLSERIHKVTNSVKLFLRKKKIKIILNDNQL